MANIPWDNQASLYRVSEVRGGGVHQDELVARGTLYELVGQFVEMSPQQQRGLLIRSADPNRSWDFDEDTIRELAARSDFAGIRDQP